MPVLSVTMFASEDHLRMSGPNLTIVCAPRRKTIYLSLPLSVKVYDAVGKSPCAGMWAGLVL